MQYIVLDMEWNQPWPGSHTAKKPLPSPMRGEIVQIGAVRLLENRTVADEFQILIQPKYFKKMNRKVSRLTGIKDAVLRESGVPFPEAMRSLYLTAVKILRFLQNNPDTACPLFLLL